MRNKDLAYMFCLIVLMIMPSFNAIAQGAPVQNFSDIYIGDLHSSHTKISDGQFSYPEEFYSAFEPYFSWIATTDHDGNIDSAEWKSMVDNAYRYNTVTSTSLLGYEWSSNTYGHMSVVFEGNSSSTGQPFNWNFENLDKSTATFEHTNKQAYDGFYSVHVKKTNSVGYSIAVLCPYIPVTGSTEYILSGWAKTNLQGFASARLRIVWCDSNGVYISEGRMLYSAQADWHERSGSFVSPPNAARAIINVGIWSDTGEAYFDKLCLKMLSDAGYYHQKANNGYIYGGTWAAGQQMYALSFDGVNDYVRVTDSPSLKPTNGNLTIALWVNPQINNGLVNSRIVNKNGANLVYQLLILSKTGQVAFALRIGGIDRAIITDEILPVGAWTHLVASYDGSNMRIFYNGVQKAVSPNYVGTLNPEESELKLGGIQGGFYNGSIDEFRVYNRTLTLSEITTLYYGGEPSTIDLVLHHTFDENQGGTIYDYSPIENLIDNPSFEVEESLANNFDPRFNTPSGLYSFLSERDAIATYAHPAMSTLNINFSDIAAYKNDTYAPLVSMFNTGNIFWNDYWNYANGTKIPSPTLIPNAFTEGYVKNALDNNYHLGFVGELDLHTKTINGSEYSYTGVVANSLSREGIFEALKSRHTFAVLSPYGLGTKTLLKATTGNYIMGDQFVYPSNTIEISLKGQTDLQSFTLVNLFVNGIVVETRVLSAQTLDEKFNVALNNGENYVFFDVRAQGTNCIVSYAFTSPMYVTSTSNPIPSPSSTPTPTLTNSNPPSNSPSQSSSPSSTPSIPEISLAPLFITAVIVTWVVIARRRQQRNRK